ncbi:non-specific lipid transfer protein GPI-anchored 2-like [Panicum miliaceum]|uniref:Non-specific lipid transfer protein GPI-anchored 2-like n=1 Tax=Panicum miliaceum TaxID=4540 RepID=A0A3L6Q2S2_PANMI|nr:non-specific lipid transfer protein GPI-anchored 2-like [Panicum miliaceum]
MAPSRELLFLLVAAAFLAAAVVPAPAQAQEYCGDSLAGLMECRGFMYGGAAAPSPACCAAYEAAFDADPFCLCYVADGTFGRATGYDVSVADALRIPAGCGQADPPIELCSMQGLVLPPYAPRPPATATAASPTAQAPSGSSEKPPPPFTSPPPPPPAPTSGASDESAALMLLFAGVALLLSCIL